jgi:hypothetical protein
VLWKRVRIFAWLGVDFRPRLSNFEDERTKRGEAASAAEGVRVKLFLGIALILIAAACWLWSARNRNRVSKQLKQNATEIGDVLERNPELKQSLVADPKVAEALKSLKGN